jgi:lipopolysaccharide assembly outer membrane protein LptD (OstA)
LGFQKPSHTFTKIHLKALRTNYFHILFTLSFTVLINTLGMAQDLPTSSKLIKSIERDSVVLVVDSLVSLPINLKETDTITSDSISKKKETLQAIVKYKAIDYVSDIRREQKIYLYNEAEVLYQDMEIKSGIIVIDYGKDLVYAGRLKDSSGVYSQLPIFKQGDNVVEPDSIIFNFKSKKALIFNSRTEQSGGYIDSEITKRENDSVIFMKEGKFTTSEDREDPEYYFRMRKAKLVPGKKIVVGLTNMYIYNVPTPIALPFAYFPMTNKQTSGLILPSPGQENNRGFFLQNGGYYFAISDYFDLAVLGDYYTNGSYGLRLESQYALKYHFNGNFGFRYENLITSERGFPDYSKSTIYNLRWSHNQDQKANPSSRFSASVNLGSSTYYQESINQINQSNFLNNTLSSSISYSKTFDTEPSINYSLTATHSQNTQTQTINMTLPTFQGSISRVFPFEPAVGTKKGILQNINLQYNIRAENRIETTDSLFFKKEMFDDALMGVKHTIPLTTNFKVLNYFSVSASTNFDENWTFNTIRRFYDRENEEVVTEDLKGFDSFRTYNFSTSIGTTVYGMFDFRKPGNDPKIQAIRHVMRPSISYNINPAFDQYYDTFEYIDADGTLTSEQYTRFQGSIFGSPNRTFSSNVGLSLANNFEMKVRPKDSTATEAKKIKILDNLNLTTSYNFAGDSLQWSPLRVSGGTQIFDSKMSINFGMILDPYALDNNNRKINTFNINNNGSLFRLTSANMNLSYSLSNSTFSGKGEGGDGLDAREERESLLSGGRSDDLFGRPQDFSDQRLTDDDKDTEKKEQSELYNYKIPWSLRLAYAVNYANNTRENEISSHSLMFSGDVDIAPRWTIGASSGYDFKNQGFTYTQLRFERDLLSWRMNFSWIPFSTQSSWSFFVGIKSNLLKDLKYDQRRRPDQRL